VRFILGRVSTGGVLVWAQEQSGDQGEGEWLHLVYVLCEGAIDALRGRYGYKSVMRGITFCKDSLTKINPKDDHTVHPVGYFK
ncbi:MAG: hypothetical protein RSE36_04985, partial [Oscillospiraceae bacterium]